MHCNSCAALIEEKFKNKPGVANAKVNFDSGKFVIIYDENIVKENDIKEIIKSAGDYEIERIEEPAPNFNAQNNSSPAVIEPKEQIANKEVLTLLKILISLVIISLAFNMIQTMAVLKQVSANVNFPSKNLAAQANQNQNDSLANPSGANDSQNAVFEIKSTDHIKGNPNAKITLVEFSDFECPFCAKHYPTLNKILADYNGKVRLVYKHFPLSFHANSQKASEASECASEQGKFWEYHDKLFENQSQGFSVDKFKQWAKDLGLNSGQFNSCLDSDKYSSKIQSDFQEGSAKGVNGTPATFVNGKLISGALPYESFKSIIDSIN